MRKLKGDPTLPRLAAAMALWEAMGFEVVHTWYESHGDGGVVVMQNEELRRHGTVVEIAYDRGGRVHAVMEDRRGDDRLLARRITDDLDEDPESWERSATRVSPCHTASWFDVRQYGETFRVTRVAGHGAWARPIDPSEFGT